MKLLARALRGRREYRGGRKRAAPWSPQALSRSLRQGLPEPRSNREIAVASHGIGRERARGARPHDASLLQDDVAVGESEQRFDGLVDDEDRQAVALQRTKAVPDLLPGQRRQSFRRLIEEQQLGVGHQCTADRQHLLLATRDLIAIVAATL